MAFHPAHFVDYELSIAKDKTDDAMVTDIQTMIEMDIKYDHQLKTDRLLDKPFQWRIAELYHGNKPATKHCWQNQDSSIQQSIIDMLDNHAALALKQMERFRRLVKFIPLYSTRLEANQDILSMLRKAWYLVNAFTTLDADDKMKPLQVKLLAAILDEVDLKQPVRIQDSDSEIGLE